MKSAENNSAELVALRTQIAAQGAMLTSDHMALLSLVEFLVASSGVTVLDGVSVQKWYQKQRLVELEKFLIRLEDVDPGAAALLQREIDFVRKPLP